MNDVTGGRVFNILKALIDRQLTCFDDVVEAQNILEKMESTTLQ